MEKYGFVYIWRDRGKDRYYIGRHWGNKDDGYICSSNWMRMSYKRRREDFRRRILCICKTKEETNKKEFEWLSLIKDEELGKRYYNFKKKYSEYTEHSIYTCVKISKKLKGRTSPRKGKKLTEETKQKIREFNLGKCLSEEQKEKISKSMLGKTRSSEHCKKISESKKGKIPWNKGKKGVYSEESNKKRSETEKITKNRGIMK